MKWLLGIISFLFCLTVSAQKNKTIIGYLRDSVTHAPVVLASITNNNTHQTVMTGSNGRFKLLIKENEVLAFAAVGYHFDTIQFNRNYAQLDSIELFASPLSHDLGNVTVTRYGFL
jgi:hypothetical protein